MLFQFAFADTASTITSGAMLGRTSFKGDILYSLGVSGFIYPLTVHWIWGPGWLARQHHGLVPRPRARRHRLPGLRRLDRRAHGGRRPRRSPAPSPSDPRIGRKFARDGGGPLPPHDINIAAIGAVMLWFGWYGFNPGSTLSAMDWEGIGRVAMNTTLAASAGGLVAVFFIYPRTKKWDVGMSINGFLGGLVAITCPCYWVSARPVRSSSVASPASWCPSATDLLEHLRIDDPVGAVPVHGCVRHLGHVGLGLFATGKYGIPTPTGADNATPIKGLFYGGGTGQLVAQVIGSLSCIVVVGILGLALMFAVRSIRGSWGLRLVRELELEGIDIAAHGLPAYHMEFGQGMAYSRRRVLTIQPSVDGHPTGGLTEGPSWLIS